MTERISPGRAGLVLDASVAIVFFASGEADAILRAWPKPCLIERRTQTEVSMLRDREASDPRAASSTIDWDAAQRAGVIEIVDLTDADLHHLVAFSVDMDSGEAAAGAFAVANNLELAIDDRKARRVLERHTTCRWSLELVSNWARSTGASDHEVGTALTAIRRYASWKPHANHPLFDWWVAHVPE